MLEVYGILLRGITPGLPKASRLQQGIFSEQVMRGTGSMEKPGLLTQSPLAFSIEIGWKGQERLILTCLRMKTTNIMFVCRRQVVQSGSIRKYNLPILPAVLSQPWQNSMHDTASGRRKCYGCTRKQSAGANCFPRFL